MRSLSNVIKSRHVFLNGDDKKTIQTNEKMEKVLFHQLSKTPITKNKFINDNESKGKEFTEGLNFEVIDLPKEDEKIPVKQLSEEILADANRQAAEIIADAKQKADAASKKMYEDSKSKGYYDGIQKAEKEQLLKQQELDQIAAQYESEYQQLVGELEPKFANLVAVYVERLTGILVENKIEVIHHLIRNAFDDADASKKFVVRVSADDMEFVVSRKEDLQSIVSSDAVVEIILDKELSQFQCLIETDSSIIECSLDAQLKNLIQDIRLLSTMG